MKENVVIAIDLGGTRIKMGLVKKGKILLEDQMDSLSHQGLAPRLPEIVSKINALLHKASISVFDIEYAGIAVPGIVDSVNHRVLSINDKYNDVPGIDLAAWAFKNWGLRLYLENDTRAALLGEWKYGKGRGHDNLALMTLGTGIGTSALIEGKILRGKHFQAGILGGHFVVNVKGNLCNCGHVGCAEAEASTWNLKKIVAENRQYLESDLNRLPTLDFKSIFQYAKKGDKLAIAVRDNCLEAWAACAWNLVMAYDPEILILGGGVMASQEYIIPFIQEKLDQNSWATWGKVQVVKASLIHSAALSGVSCFSSNY